MSDESNVSERRADRGPHAGSPGGVVDATRSRRNLRDDPIAIPINRDSDTGLLRLITDL